MNIPGWLRRWRVTSTWSAHIGRGSRGGVDWATPVGTTIVAPSAGWLDFRFYGSGESVLRLLREDRSVTEFLHGRLNGGNGRWVREGDTIGVTDGRRGTLGAGWSTGPHVHVHDVTADGRRVAPFSTIEVPASDLPIAVIDYEEENEMRPVVFERSEGKAEWCLAAPWLVGDDDKEQGYLVTANAEIGVAWLRMYALGSGSNKVDRAGYVAVQAEARRLRAQWLENGNPWPQLKIVEPVRPAGPAPTVEALAAAIAANLGARLAD